MTKDEALEILEAFANYLDAGPTAKHHVKELRDVIAALSSPCARGEPLAEGDGTAWLSAGSFGSNHYYVGFNFPLGKRRTRSFPIHVLIFGADEPQEEKPVD